MDTLFDRIQQLCTERGISRYALEKNLGFGKASMGRWDTNTPSIDKVQKVADYFDVSLDYLMTGKEKPSQSEERSETKAKLLRAIDNMTDEEAAAWLKILKL